MVSDTLNVTKVQINITFHLRFTFYFNLESINFQFRQIRHLAETQH